MHARESIVPSEYFSRVSLDCVCRLFLSRQGRRREERSVYLYVDIEYQHMNRGRCIPHDDHLSHGSIQLSSASSFFFFLSMSLHRSLLLLRLFLSFFLPFSSHGSLRFLISLSFPRSTLLSLPVLHLLSSQKGRLLLLLVLLLRRVYHSLLVCAFRVLTCR